MSCRQIGWWVLVTDELKRERKLKAKTNEIVEIIHSTNRNLYRK